MKKNNSIDKDLNARFDRMNKVPLKSEDLEINRKYFFFFTTFSQRIPSLICQNIIKNTLINFQVFRLQGHFIDPI